jgi:protocatechuate 3,4-dioxygenase beta subunit
MHGTRGNTWIRFGVALVGVLCGVGIAFSQAARFGLTVIAAGRPAGTSAPSQSSAGTATLTVQVVAGDTGAPVRGARVSVFGMPAAPQRAPAQGAPGPAASPPWRVQMLERTDQAGIAAFTSLPAARYSIAVAPPAAFVTPPSVPLVLATDGASTNALVRLDRGGVLTGRVLDEDGAPVTGASVSAYWRQTAAGVVRPVQRGLTRSTDDLGQFRIWGLPPGDYFVKATFSDYGSGAPVHARVGPLPTFYPGVAAFDRATTAAVKALQETGGVDFRLVRGGLGSVTGRATDSSGDPLASVGQANPSVTLVPRNPTPAAGNYYLSLRPDGTFTIGAVAPGDYYLIATRGSPFAPGRVQEGAFVPVSVNGDDAAANIQTNLGATVSGRVVIEAAQTGDRPRAPSAFTGSASMQVRVVPATYNRLGDLFASVPPAVVHPDGTFKVFGVRGPAHLLVSGGQALKAMTRGGRDISGQPLELVGTERVDDVVLVLTQETGSIEGVVNNERGQPMSEAPVLVFFDDPARWSPQSPFVRPTRTTSADGSGAAAAAPSNAAASAASAASVTPGAFWVGPLPAGRYAVVAFPAGVGSIQPDRESLARWRKSATVVTVEAGQTATVKLTPIK